MPASLRLRLLVPPALAALFAGMGLWACGEGGADPAGRGGAAPAFERPNVVLVSIDTLRADHLSCYGYFRETSPRIDALARESVVFERAYAPMATTLPSHSSMFTGLYPLEHGILANAEHGGASFGWKREVVSLAEVFQGAGYRTGGFVSATPLKRGTGFESGFDHYDQPKGKYRRGHKTLAGALEWLGEDPEEPFFLFVHFFDPHGPRHAPEPFGGAFEAGAELEAFLDERAIARSLERPDREPSIARVEIDAYCGEILYTDAQVGRLLDALDARGLGDTTIVALVGDHGEGLNQHDYWAHGLVWEEQLRVPMMLRLPDPPPDLPDRFGRVVSLVDLAPTLLGRIAALRTPLADLFSRQVSGVDVLAPGFEERPVFAQRTARKRADGRAVQYALTARRWKWIEEPGRKAMLFDLRRDPHELEDVAARHPDQARRLAELTARAVAEQAERGARLSESGLIDAGEFDPERLRELRELGYLGGEQ